MSTAVPQNANLNLNLYVKKKNNNDKPKKMANQYILDIKSIFKLFKIGLD